MAVQYEQIFDHAALFISAKRRLNYLADIMSRISEKYWIENDDSDQTKDWLFRGLRKGWNTGANGQLWVELTDTAGTRKVEIFKDSAKTLKVASGTKVGDGVLPFIEVGASGISGTVYVTYSGDDLDIQITVDFSWPVLVDAIPLTISGLGEVYDDAYSNLQTAIQGALDGSAGELTSIWSALESVFDVNFWLGIVAIEIESGEASAWSYTESRASDGAITISEAGILQDFIQAMIDDAQDVQENTVACPAPTAGGDNVGDVTVTTKTPRSWVRNEKIKVRCTKTLDSALERFEVIGSISGAAQNSLTLNAIFRSHDLAMEIQLDRKNTYDGSYLSNIVLLGEKSAYVSSEGKLYTKITNPSGSTYLLEIFSNSARTEAYKVAEGQRDGAGTIVATQYGGSGLTVTATLSVGTEEKIIDLHVCHVNDIWYFEPTNNEKGLWLTMIARMYPGAELPNSSSPSIEDGLAGMPVDELLQLGDAWEGLE